MWRKLVISGRNFKFRGNSGWVVTSLNMFLWLLILSTCGCLCTRRVYSDSHAPPPLLNTVISSPLFSSTQRLLSAIQVDPSGKANYSLSMPTFPSFSVFLYSKDLIE